MHADPYRRVAGRDGPNTTHDVVVLGSGLASSITAIILARRGWSVAMIERGTHPRPAIGESLVPTSALWFWLLGDKHDVPEIRTLGHLDSITRNVGPSSGVKRGFGYAYHRPGQRAVDPLESSRFIGPKQPIFKESQLYRPAVDHHLVRAAVGYGVRYRDRTTVTGFAIEPDGVRVDLDDGSEIRGRVVVDGTGRNSVVGRELGLRERPTRLRTSSRSIFGHVRNVAVFDEVAPGADARRQSAGWHEGTIHHVFDGGWFWVIPFDNHPDSTSDLTSVGLTLDTDRHPRPDGIDPAKEFQDVVGRFPVVERHLGGIEPVGEMVGTDRLQYSSRSAVADRTVLLHHAYGFVDPLFSRGIWRSLETVDVVVDHLLAALDDDDLSAERLAPIDRAQASMLDHTDQLVRNAYRASADYETWTAWVRIWFADEFLTTLPMMSAAIRSAGGSDRRAFERLGGGVRPGTGYSFTDGLESLVDEAEAVLDGVADGRFDARTARRRIALLLGGQRELPHALLAPAGDGPFGMDLTPATLARLTWWGRTRAPAGFRAEAFDFRVRDLLRLLLLDAVRPSALSRDDRGNLVGA